MRRLGWLAIALVACGGGDGGSSPSAGGGAGGSGASSGSAGSSGAGASSGSAGSSGAGASSGSAGSSGAGASSGSGGDGGSSGAGWPLEPAACGTWAEGTQDADDGATRDFYNRAAGLAFANQLGDWTDINGVPQGDAPYAVTAVADDNTTGWQSWDLTTLVQGWVDGTWANKGLLISSAPGPFEFASKEHSVAGERPELVVETGSGTQSFAPVADTYLSDSTYQGFGDSDVLKIGNGTHTLMRFGLDELPI